MPRQPPHLPHPFPRHNVASPKPVPRRQPLTTSPPKQGCRWKCVIHDIPRPPVCPHNLPRHQRSTKRTRPVQPRQHLSPGRVALTPSPVVLDPQLPRLRILEAVLETLVDLRRREDVAPVDPVLRALVEILSHLCSTLC